MPLVEREEADGGGQFSLQVAPLRIHRHFHVSQACPIEQLPQIPLQQGATPGLMHGFLSMSGDETIERRQRQHSRWLGEQVARAPPEQDIELLAAVSFAVPVRACEQRFAQRLFRRRRVIGSERERGGQQLESEERQSFHETSRR
ncbi:MAG: hypothetical protein ABI821_00465 [Pseudomonadota bacterium]